MSTRHLRPNVDSLGCDTITPSFSRSAKVGDHAASTRSERSSEADSQTTDERTRDTSSEAAPMVARRPSSGLQIVHYDALNPHRSVSDVLSSSKSTRVRGSMN